MSPSNVDDVDVDVDVVNGMALGLVRLDTGLLIMRWCGDDEEDEEGMVEVVFAALVAAATRAS